MRDWFPRLRAIPISRWDDSTLRVPQSPIIIGNIGQLEQVEYLNISGVNRETLVLKTVNVLRQIRVRLVPAIDRGSQRLNIL